MRNLIVAFLAMLLGTGAMAHVEPFPAEIQSEMIDTNGTQLYVRHGGHGPVVVMLHGFGETGDMWAPLTAALIKDHTVIVPDLRGMGLSAHPDDGYTKLNQAADIAGVLDHFHVTSFSLVTHDIGNMVGYALASQNSTQVSRWAVIDAPLPGIGDWNAFMTDQRVWHWNFRGADAERLVAGRERIYLDRFYNELSARPEAIDEPTRDHYAALYSRPHAMHDAFEQFAAFRQDAADNVEMLGRVGKLRFPVLALGAEKSFGAKEAEEIRNVATDVTGSVIPGSGHWVMEEQPAATVKLVDAFLRKQPE